ncbi:hypothetical protein [Streptomyces sp. NK08204]|uniref:hypothetical protein n=1 Tax=Streptomyces sp. NK08204 TaxID=2873260 RepID=UPI001CEC7C86|nr:hypothetical protein [Streptomyces sp. NK08204]
MQGHGYVQPVKQPPHTGWLVFLRVLFVAVGIFTLGIFAWVMLLRLAVVTRRPLDWGLFTTALVTDSVSMVFLATEPGDEIHTARGWLGLFLLLFTLVCATAYYLSAEIRHFMLVQQTWQARRPAPAYGYPAAGAPPFTATTVPMAPAPPLPQPPPTPSRPPTGSQPPLTGSQPPLTPSQPLLATPPPQRPAPARIDQVRAELDELSDYLRKHDGQQGGNHEGGR